MQSINLGLWKQQRMSCWQQQNQMECKSAARCTLIRLSKASLVTNNSPEVSAKKSLKIFLVSRHLIAKLISSCHSQSHSCSENYIITVTDYHEYIPEMSERAPQNYARASESYVEAAFHVEGRNLFRNAFPPTTTLSIKAHQEILDFQRKFNACIMGLACLYWYSEQRRPSCFSSLLMDSLLWLRLFGLTGTWNL